MRPRQGRRRAGGRAGVLCGGDQGDAEVGDWGGWGGGVREKTWNKPIDHGARIND